MRPGGFIAWRTARPDPLTTIVRKAMFGLSISSPDAAWFLRGLRTQ
jgi:hypothetical protein